MTDDQNAPSVATESAATTPEQPSPAVLPSESKETQSVALNAAEPLLTALEVRVLGSLIEKECTTPDTYPMTLNSLVLACNQKSNRAPLMEVDAHAVTSALDTLKDKKYLWVVTAIGSRVPKYQHDLAKRLQVSGGARAILCELFLRGPQTAAELRSRAARMHTFADTAEFERALEDLVNRPSMTLAARVAAAPGQRGLRYAHLLSGPVESVASAMPATKGMEAPTPTGITERLSAIEADVAALRTELTSLRQQLGGTE